MQYGKIFCDLDAVLVNFEEPAVKVCNEAIKEGRFPELAAQVKKDMGRKYLLTDDLQMSKKETNPKSIQNLLYKTLAGNSQFWATLPFMPDGEKLWRVIGNRACILSKPMDEASVLGKLDWISKNLRLSSDRIFLTPYTSSATKSDYAMTGDLPNILIDDYHKFIDTFVAAGGIGILHTNTVDTVRQLQRILMTN